MPLLGTRTTVPTKSMGYSPGHGRVLRSARRSFARNVARRLAETRMAELERTQLGETEQREHAVRLAEMGAKSRMADIERAETGATRRKGMEIAGGAEQRRLDWVRGTGALGVAKATEIGKETRHLRQYGPEGTAAQRLSWVKEQAVKEKAAEDFTTRAGGILGKYITRTEEGEMIDPALEPAFRRAQAEATEDPTKALEGLSAVVAQFEETKAERTKLENLTPEAFAREYAGEKERIRISQLTPEARAGEEATRLATKRATTARRLAAEYEEENVPPSIFGRLSEAWRTRRPSPYVTAPTGLR